MSDESPTFAIEELARTADVPVRTVRYYIAEGLVPRPGARGKSASYGADHLSRLLLIRRLVERHVPLAEIRRLVERLTPDDTQALLREEEERRHETLSLDTATTSPRDYISGLLERARAARSGESDAGFRSWPKPPYGGGERLREPAQRQQSESRSLGQWERLELAPGVELHVHVPLDERQRRLVARLTQVAHEATSDEST